MYKKKTIIFAAVFKFSPKAQNTIDVKEKNQYDKTDTSTT